MAQIDTKILIEKFNAGTITLFEEEVLEQYMAKGEIDPKQLIALQRILLDLEALPTPEPETSMDNRFYTLLAEEKRKQRSSANMVFKDWWVSVWQSQWQVAYTAAILIVGITVGIIVRQPSQNEIETLTSEMKEMKELLMLNMLAKESTTDRLRAVSLTSEMGTASDKVATALINTLRTDENNNVRMAAIEALAHYTSQPDIRKELIASIQYQKSPLVQLALAELMVAMNEKGAKKAFDQLWKTDYTPQEVRVAINEKMQTMI